MHLWSADAPHALVCMEKQRLVFIENEKAEDPIACDAQICDFSDMQVTLVKIEEIMKSVDARRAPSLVWTRPQSRCSLSRRMTSLRWRGPS